MRIGLGTAQFGLDYGISNPSGQVAQTELGRILALAREAGIRVVDTASAYGDAEERLGLSLEQGHPFSIVTKLPPPPSDLRHSATKGWVHEAFDRSRVRLRTTHVYGLLMHSAADLTGPRGADTWRALEELRDDGVVRKIGASVYGASEIDALLGRFPLQLIQLPVNVLDQRLARSGHLARLQAAGTEVHGRSVFMQGLLLMDPESLTDRHFAPVRQTLRAFQEAARAAGRSPLEAAVSFVLSLPEVDTAVFGVLSATQLAEILSASTSPLPPDWYARFALDDEQILDPSRWPR